VLDPREVGGEAPKDFIWVRRPGAKRAQTDHRTWPAYIAKVGHKMYPSESITEQIFTRIGQIWRLDIADSELMVCAQQIRFLSRYFLRPGEILNHGAEILGGYLADRDFVEGVSVQRAERELFTFQVFRTAIEASFPDHHEDLIRGFVRMLGFDALVGNQDRHFNNWGVITHTTGLGVPRFAPIYDTARGLFWNDTESSLVKYKDPQSLEAYVRRSKPLIGWDGWNKSELTQFQLVECLGGLDMRYWRLLEELGKQATASVSACEGMIDAEFGDLLSDMRRDLIKRCLRVRVDTFAKIF